MSEGSRIRPLDRDDVSAEAQAFFDRDERLFGVVLNATRVLAHRPPILAGMWTLSRSVAQDPALPAELRALVCLRVATLVGCPFWIDLSAAGSSAVGVPQTKIAALADFKASPLYTEAECAALELAEAVSAGQVEVPDELFERLRASYDERQLVELAATCALENFRARFSRVFRIEPNGLYCSIPGSREPEI